MRRSIAVVLVFAFSSALPRLAAAEPEPLPSCETVTTVRCTGSAAPLALPGAAPAPVAPGQRVQIAPPAPVPAPLPPVAQADDAEVPCCTPAPRAAAAAAAPPTVYAPALLPGGWRLVHGEGGSLLLERRKRAPVAGVWVPGLVIWLTTYVGAAIGGAANDEPWTTAPFFGAFAAAGINLANGHTGAGVGYAIGGVLQLSGFITFLIGLAAGEKIDRMPVRISPMASRDGGGLNLGMRF